MISIKMTGMCEGCDLADLDLVKYKSMSRPTFWNITCSHWAVCSRSADAKLKELKLKLKEEMEGIE